MKKLTPRQAAILKIIRQHGPIGFDGVVARVKLRRFDVVQALYALIAKDRVSVGRHGDTFRAIGPAAD